MESLDDLNRIRKKVLDACSEDAAGRAAYLAFAFAALFVVYGFSSLDFIQKFDPSIHLWGNIWPRLLISGIPFSILGWYLKSSSSSAKIKLNVWSVGFPILLNGAAWIHIWPLALHRSPEILIYVHSANLFLYAVAYAAVCPPGVQLLYFSIFLFGLFIAPLLTVTYFSGDLVILKMVASETSEAILGAIVLCKFLDRLRQELVSIKFRNEFSASKFLGPVVTKAIFEGEHDRLRKVQCVGFIISIDIRDSTNLQKDYGQSWLDFRQQYFKLVSEVVSKNAGYIQKTIGDCHVINFGVMDYGPDLSDIPGIEEELKRAEDQRLQRASDNAFSFLNSLFSQFTKLSRERFPQRRVYLGAGVDKGIVERAVQGDAQHSLELDVNGDPVNCCSRLQEYSKQLREDYKLEGSVLVVSPFAADYLSDFGSYLKVPTTSKPIRNYQAIKWVLVRRFCDGDVVQIAA